MAVVSKTSDSSTCQSILKGRKVLLKGIEIDISNYKPTRF